MAKRAYYCYECLRKYQDKQFKENSDCPHCDCELRECKNARARAATVTRLARHRGLRPPKKRNDYEKYLQSDLWKTIRARIYIRDDYCCLDCGRKADAVHHLSYAPEVMAGKDDSKLIAICNQCHLKRHNRTTWKKTRKKKQVTGRLSASR